MQVKLPALFTQFAWVYYTRVKRKKQVYVKASDVSQFARLVKFILKNTVRVFVIQSASFFISEQALFKVTWFFHGALQLFTIFRINLSVHEMFAIFCTTKVC